MATAVILNFGKSGIVGHSNPCMVNAYPHTKFEANILISDRDMGKNPNPRWRQPLSCIFSKVAFWVTVTPWWSLSISAPNWRQLSKIWIHDGGRRHLEFCRSGMLDYSEPDMVNVHQCAKFEANIFINDRDMAKNPKSKVAAAAILNFGKSVIFGTYDTGMKYVDLHTKFGGNLSRNGWDTHVYISSRWRPSTILDVS